MRLNQVIAVVGGLKERAKKRQSEAYHKLQKGELLLGISRTYRPKDDEGDKLPAQRKFVQFSVREALGESRVALVELFDLLGTLDVANCSARADVRVDGVVVLCGVPVTYLMVLEKELVDLRTQVGKLPTLDPAEKWSWSDSANAFATEPRETTSTKKVRKNWVKAEATKEHPAQVEVFDEDVVVGFWETVNFSGAIPEVEKLALLERVCKLLEAVKCAREEANLLEVEKQSFGRAVFDFLGFPVK